LVDMSNLVRHENAVTLTFNNNNFNVSVVMGKTAVQEMNNK
jgi:hypothetical protein